MSVIDLEFTGVVTNSGFTNPADVAVSNDTRATEGDKNDFIIVDVDNAPGDYGDTNSGNTVVLKVEGRHSSGTPSRAKSFTIELLDSSNVAINDSSSNPITFTTLDLTDTDATQSSGVFTLADNYLAADVDGWRLRITSNEGGGMADSITTEIDFLRLTLDYDVAAAGQTLTPLPITVGIVVTAATILAGALSLTPAPVTAAFSVVTPTIVNVDPLLRTTVGLLAVYIANDGDDPFVATDWELQSNTSAVQVDGTTGELEFESQGLGRMRHSGTGASSRSKRMVQGLVYSPSSPPAGNPQNYPGIAGHMETGSGGDDALLIVGVLTNDGGGDGYAVTEDAAGVQEGTTGGGLPYKAYDIDYRFSIYVNGSSAATGHDFDQAESQNLTPVVLTSGHAGIIGCCNNDWANYKEWWDTKDRNILCLNLPTGFKLKIRDASQSVLKSATESSGTATLDMIDVDLSDVADIVVTDGSDVLDQIFHPGPTSDYIVGGDIYNYAASIVLTPAAMTAAFAVPTPTIVAGQLTLTPAAITAVWNVPTPTVDRPKTLTPAAILAAFSVPTPTVVVGQVTLTPAAIIAIFGVPTPTLQSPKTLSPAAITGSWVVPTPIVNAVKTLVPTAVTALWGVPTPVVALGPLTLTPVALIAAWVVPTPTLGVVNVLTPAAITAAWAVPTPTVAVGAVVLTPTAVVALWSVPTPTVVPGGLTIVAAPVVASWAVPTPTVVIGQIILTPAPVVANWIVPTPALNVVNILTPAAITAAWVVPTPTITSGVNLTPAPVTAAWGVPTPSIAVGALVLTPTALAAVWSVPTPTVDKGALILTPSPVIAVWGVPTPSLVSPKILTPSAITAAWSVPLPTIVAGQIVLAPAPMVASWLVPLPTVILGQVTLSPSSIVATWAVPTPTMATPKVLSPAPVIAVWGVVDPTVVVAGDLSPLPVTASWVVLTPGITNSGAIATGLSVDLLRVGNLREDELKLGERIWR